MPELAAASFGESLIAESFAAAAPEMFIPVEAMGAEFGTAAAFDALGAGALGGLEGLGMAGLEGISGAAPSITEAATQGIVSGGVGAGEAGINAAQVAAEQANAAEIANSGINQAAQQGAERFADTTNASFPQTNPAAAESAMNNPAAQPGAGINQAYQHYDPVQEQLAQVPGGRLVPAQTGSSIPTTESSGLMGGFQKAMDWVKENPFSAASMGMNALSLLNKKSGSDMPAKEEYNGILSKYKMSPEFQGRFARPEDYQYTPKVYGMAEGGIASYKSGGEAAMDYYERMTRAKENAPSGRSDPGSHYAGDVGIIFDTDPDTRSLDPVTAAQVRMAKVNKRANMQTAGLKRPTPMGQLNLVPVTMKGNPNAPDMTEAAHGGIMSLGGYAAGGNPRLLKGPGDGMSDNIPATIANKQPARLADGEFVVPADVVSHLGNGSTDAGAKRLHEMMTEVRKARTGNPKQGKQINPNKFVPT